MPRSVLATQALCVLLTSCGGRSTAVEPTVYASQSEPVRSHGESSPSTDAPGAWTLAVGTHVNDAMELHVAAVARHRDGREVVVSSFDRFCAGEGCGEFGEPDADTDPDILAIVEEHQRASESQVHMVFGPGEDWWVYRLLPDRVVVQAFRGYGPSALKTEEETLLR